MGCVDFEGSKMNFICPRARTGQKKGDDAHTPRKLLIVTSAGTLSGLTKISEN
jgi:hypothetical protein